MSFKKHSVQKLISGLIVVSVIMPSLVVWSTPKKARALFGAGDIVFDIPAETSVYADLGISIKNAAIEIGKQLLMSVARKALQEITKSTVNWINSGFHGSPLFLENSDSFFKDITKSEIRFMVDTFGYDQLKYPFGKDFALSTIYSYKSTLEDNAAYSLSWIIDDPVYLYNFQNDFNVGGWNGFFLNTQYPQNNYLGSQMIYTDALARRLQNTSQKVEQTLDRGMGFLSPQTCLTNPEYNNGYNEFVRPSFSGVQAEYTKNHPLDLEATAEQVAEWRRGLEEERARWEAENTCPGGLVSTTPGSVVASQITKALDIPSDSAIMAAGLGNSLSAIFDALLNHFMEKGLNALETEINGEPREEDTWSYNGLTLGSPTTSGAGVDDWASGPEQEIVLGDFKKTIQDAIDNTTLEIKLLDNNSDANNPGIRQVLNMIWPATMQLDQCLPGLDLNWQSRLSAETERAGSKLQARLNSDDQLKVDAALEALSDLNLAVDYFASWLTDKIATSLPSSGAYLDAVNDIGTVHQQFADMTRTKKIRTDALLRLESIQNGLSVITAQPDPGSEGEKTLIDLRKKYDAALTDISNSYTIGETENELDTTKDKLINLNKLLAKCETERTALGWSIPGGADSTLKDSGTEQSVFCDTPIAEMVNVPDVRINCNVIYRASILDYKKDLSL